MPPKGKRKPTTAVDSGVQAKARDLTRLEAKPIGSGPRRIFWAVLAGLAALAWMRYGPEALRNLKMRRLQIPFSYTSEPGQSLGLPFFDETGNQLCDGKTGRDNFRDDLGNGAAYEWVGWRDIDPTIVLDLGSVPQKVSTIQIHANGNVDQGVAFLRQVALSVSKDGTNFDEEKTTNVQPQAGKPSQWFVVNVGGAEVKTAKLRLIDNTATGWILISEIKIFRPEK